jgi:hypothetical protein
VGQEHMSCCPSSDYTRCCTKTNTTMPRPAWMYTSQAHRSQVQLESMAWVCMFASHCRMSSQGCSVNRMWRTRSYTMKIERVARCSFRSHHWLAESTHTHTPECSSTAQRRTESARCRSRINRYCTPQYNYVHSPAQTTDTIPVCHSMGRSRCTDSECTFDSGGALHPRTSARCRST